MQQQFENYLNKVGSRQTYQINTYYYLFIDIDQLVRIDNFHWFQNGIMNGQNGFNKIDCDDLNCEHKYLDYHAEQLYVVSVIQFLKLVEFMNLVGDLSHDEIMNGHPLKYQEMHMLQQLAMVLQHCLEFCLQFGTSLQHPVYFGEIETFLQNNLFFVQWFNLVRPIPFVKHVQIVAQQPQIGVRNRHGVLDTHGHIEPLDVLLEVVEQQHMVRLGVFGCAGQDLSGLDFHVYNILNQQILQYFIMSQIINPSIFIFQEILLQHLDFLKRYIKKSKIDELDLYAVSQEKTLNLEKYNQYLLIGLTNPKTKDPTYNFYEKIYRQNLCDKRSLPENLITRLLKESENEHSTALSKCLSAIMTNKSIFLTNIEKSKCLKYLLDCSRNKQSGSQFGAILQDIFNYLAPYSEPQIGIFVSYFTNYLINEVELHNAEDIQYSLSLHVHHQGGKYGRCFMCNKPANNFDKQIFVPLCGFQCKSLLTEMRVRIDNHETFDLFNWLIDQSIYGDEIVFKEIEKEIRVVKKRISQKHLKIIFPELLKNAKTNQNISLTCHKIFAEIFSSHKSFLKNELKVYMKEMIRQLESSTNTNHRISILKLFTELYKNADNIHTIFVNYDCKFYQNNILQEQVSVISKISISDEDPNIRGQAKKCFVELLRTEVDFIKSRSIEFKIDLKMEDEEISRERKVKSHAEKAILLFNKKPNTGIEYLKSNYFENQQMTILDIAKFIKQHTQTQTKVSTQKIKLKKAKIGEFFGQLVDFNIECYKAFLNLINFQGLKIDDALRELLSHFTLPRQSQQIARVIQHFTNKYQNYTTFDADGIYLLSYAIVMLQTSLYNPEVKQADKLKLQDFINICKGIKNIDKQQIQRIYSSIQTIPLSKKPEFSQSYMINNAYLNPYDQFQESTSSIVSSVLQYIWQYVYVSLVDKVNTQGLYEAVVAYGSCQLEEVQGFISALVTSAQKKNVVCSDILLKLAAFEGRSLGKSWHLIIKFIFEMEEGDIGDKSEFDTSIIDKIMHASIKLSEDKFVQFIYEFCKFSTSDSKHQKYNRQMFVLRHIIEIISYNIDRIVSLWPELWKILNDYFLKICLHPRADVSMASIDSFKQLSLKFLKIPETDLFLQRQFLSPFQYIFQRSNLMTKELIVNILGMLITKELKSGWEIIFAVLEKSENQAVLRVVQRIVEIGLKYVYGHHKLQSILVKQLLVSNDQQISKTFFLLEVITKFINTKQAWIYTLKTIRGKYEISLNQFLLRSFFELVGSMDFEAQQIFEQISALNSIVSKSKDYENSNLIFKHINDLPTNILIKNFGMLTEMWEVNFQSENRRVFLGSYYAQIIKIFGELDSTQTQILVYNLLRKHNQSLPVQLLKIKELDQDFKKNLYEMPETINNKSDLIELTLEKQRYEYNSMLHLVTIRIFSNVSQYLSENKVLLNKIMNAVYESYNLSTQFNKCILLRLFLWKNGFMNSSSNLPGLLKQELFSLNYIIRYDSSQSTHKLKQQVLSDYNSRCKLYKKLSYQQEENILRKINRQEIDRYLQHFKPIVIQIIGTFSQLENGNSTRSLMELILDIIQNTKDTQILKHSTTTLKHLLRKCIQV